MPPSPADCYAIVAPGVEKIAAAELRSLGLEPIAIEPGGVSFRTEADLAGVYAANLHLRTVSRVVLRVATFHASTFYELERRAKRVPWTRFLVPGTVATFRVTSRKSRLYHQRAIEQRLAEVAGVISPPNPNPGPDSDEAGVGQIFVVRVFRDEFTVSVDTSGELLHRRGYRLATAKAPLRETLAAAMLLAAGWDGRAPLLDPMCGSGTIPIEAALLARRIAPGRARSFAFERWPEFDTALWRRIQAEADERAVPRALTPIMGSDRDAGAIAAAQANAARAGVAQDVQFDRHSISAIEPPAGLGWVVSNPPYGGRVGDRRPLRDLYAQFGHMLRRRCPGWEVVLLSAHRELDRQTSLAFAPLLATSNGGIYVQLVRGRVPGREPGRVTDQAPIVSPPSTGSTSPVM